MDPTVESTSPLPVKNLRSKFEQLSVSTPTSNSKPAATNGLLAPDSATTTARPRAASGNSTKPSSTPPDTHHLRPSSSSSDLRTAGDALAAALKRPPPPPPRSRTGASPAASPGPSPLLRPVPAPPLNPTSPKPNIAVALPSSYEGEEGQGLSLTGSAAALRNKLSSMSTTSENASIPKLLNGLPVPNDVGSDDSQSPSPSVSTLREKFHRSATMNVTIPLKGTNDTPPAIPLKPAIPPRPPRISETHAPPTLTPLSALAHSPDELTPVLAPSATLASGEPAITRTSRTPSPGTPNAPPALPARKIPHQVYNHSAGASESTSSIASSTRSLNSNSSQFLISATNTGNSTNTNSTENSSITSVENDSNLPPAPFIAAKQSPPRPGVVAPPRLPPPPRHRTLMSPLHIDTPLPPFTGGGTLPPPLPARRGAASPIPFEDPLPPPPPPRLPSRPANHPISIKAHSSADIPISSPTTEKKAVALSKHLPPPPTRMIGLGDKLPPARRPTTPSSEDESGGEDDDVMVSGTGIKNHAGHGHGIPPPTVDALPDTSQTSRRLPLLLYRENYSEPKVPVPAHVGQAVVSGTNIVVGIGHGLRIYDVGISDGPIKSMDGKELAISGAVANGNGVGGSGKENLKVTCMEMKGMGDESVAGRGMRGNLCWIGTKEGHLLEMDVRTGQMHAAKWAAHLSPIVYIGRVERTMVSIDEGGKVLIFQPEGKEEASLLYTQPKVLRIGERQDFVRLVGRKLWTASRCDQQLVPVHAPAGVGANGNGGPAFLNSTKLPVIKVFDIFNPGLAVRSVVPTEHVGTVLCATVIPSNPAFVYVGHEEGYVSVWDVNTEECLEVIKVSTSDVLCLEGVNDKLWSGSRNGVISVYDVSCKPWIVTNSWMAHPGLPVLKLMVDVWGIEKTGRLAVVSVGRDELLRVWDGLLGTDWIEHELWKQENAFTKQRDLSVLIVTWNVDAAKPEVLTGDPANMTFFDDVLQSVAYPDIISFGFQEVMDLENRKMAAKNVLLGGSSSKKSKAGGGGTSEYHHHHNFADSRSGGMNGTAGGGLSDKVTSSYKRWYDKLQSAVRKALPDVQYIAVATESLVGLFSCVFVKQTEKPMLRDVAITTIKRGMGGRYGNKGGIVARFVIDDTSVCLINCHLAAGQNAVRQRNADVAGMLEEKAVFSTTNHPVAYVRGGDGSMVLDHEIVFVSEWRHELPN
ncbi:hypothetical protein AX16_008530 [Volvariella volvacea WC 439]|nr:hypothetical protein AX16_008530 [Volvariella volvacea WC 439]